jgi:hypothetical protein
MILLKQSVSVKAVDSLQVLQIIFDKFIKVIKNVIKKGRFVLFILDSRINKELAIV